MTPAAASWAISVRVLKRGAVDVAVAPAVAGLHPSVAGRRRQHSPQAVGERALVDPVAAVPVALLHVEGADRPVGQPVDREVQVVEHHHRPQRDLPVHRPARGAADDGPAARGAQRQHVGAVVDVVGEPHVALAVARQVDDLDPGVGPAGQRRGAPRRVDRLGTGAGEVRQRVGPRAGDDADRHGTIATTRAGAAEPPTIRRGKHDTVNPVAGSSPRFISRSIWQ